MLFLQNQSNLNYFGLIEETKPEEFLKVLNAKGEDVEAKFEFRPRNIVITTEEGRFEIKHYWFERIMNGAGFVEFGPHRKKLKTVSSTNGADTQNKSSKSVINGSLKVDLSDIKIEKKKLKDIELDPEMLKTYMSGTDLDYFVTAKGGFYPGRNMMITGEPGSKKSSLVLFLLNSLAVNNPGMKVGFVSAEMDEYDVAEIGQYIPGLEENVDILIMDDYVDNDETPDFNIVLQAWMKTGYQFIGIDSLYMTQCIIAEELELGEKKAEAWLRKLCKKHNKGKNDEGLYTAFFDIQQMTKGGEFVGTKVLEHMITQYMHIFGKGRHGEKKTRIVFKKNRKNDNCGEKLHMIPVPTGFEFDITEYRTKRESNEINKAPLEKEALEKNTMTFLKAIREANMEKQMKVS